MFFKKRKPALVKGRSCDDEYRFELDGKVIGYLRGNMLIHEHTDSFFELTWFHVDKEY